MTMPSERTRAVQWARDFLRRLLNSQATPRVDSAIRTEARYILRHYPSDWDLDIAAKSDPIFPRWASPEPAEQLGFAADEPVEHYSLTLTLAQAEALAHACEVYLGGSSGQCDNAAESATSLEAAPLISETLTHLNHVRLVLGLRQAA